jgi:hypothetical protein
MPETRWQEEASLGPISTSLSNVVRTFSTKARRLKLSGKIKLSDVQRAVEKHFMLKLDKEFQGVRDVGHAVFV